MTQPTYCILTRIEVKARNAIEAKAKMSVKLKGLKAEFLGVGCINPVKPTLTETVRDFLIEGIEVLRGDVEVDGEEIPTLEDVRRSFHEAEAKSARLPEEITKAINQLCIKYGPDTYIEDLL